MVRSAAKSLTSLWKDRSLNLQLKCRLMQTLVWSVAMYGCESWTLKAADSKRTKRLRDGHVQKDDANQLEGTQN